MIAPKKCVKRINRNQNSLLPPRLRELNRQSTSIHTQKMVASKLKTSISKKGISVSPLLSVRSQCNKRLFPGVFSIRIERRIYRTIKMCIVPTISDGREAVKKPVWLFPCRSRGVMVQLCMGEDNSPRPLIVLRKANRNNGNNLAWPLLFPVAWQECYSDH